MNPYQFRVSLRLKHPTKDLSFVTQQLGMKPSRQWTSGKARLTSAGVPLKGNYQESYWVAALLEGNLQDSTKQSLDETLETILRRLSRHTLFLEQFRRDGGSLYLFVGIFGPRNFGLEFSPALLSELGASGLELGLDVYPGGPNDVSLDGLDASD